MDELTEKFYKKTLRPDRQRSYEMIVDYIMHETHPNTKSVIDFGCGAGWFLYYFKKKYNVKVFGIEPNKEMLGVIDESVKPYVEHLSIADEIVLDGRYDLAMNIEVIEHIPKEYEDIVLKNITSYSKNLVFSAAHPGQGGVGHVNEKPFSYWRKKLNKIGWHLDEMNTRSFRVMLHNNKAAKWYIQNLSLFRKGLVIEKREEDDFISD